ncbi:MAG TPA: enolase C-terminal domain-like protein [Polyangiaceae bacterium]|nr:enolase C-terminal domain-like protein [Polyangiaceae bacterium]
MAEPSRSSGGPRSRVERVRVSAFDFPTDDEVESDGTLSWGRTVLVTVEASSEGLTGLGYTYADGATARLADSTLAPVVLGTEVCAPPANHARMVRAVRNLGREGIAAMAVSAIDTALWDLKARWLGVSLLELLGPARDAVALYGSGGFTSYGAARLQAQLAGWAARGIERVKLKVGSEPHRDVERVAWAREAIGRHVELFVDANGAYTRKHALQLAERFAELGVTWFEEPVSSDDLPGLALLVDRCPPSIEVAAGEYGYHASYFEQLIRARAVDVVQADATRCGGVTGFLRAAALCDAHAMPLSAHCAPSLHAHLGCAASRLRHVEYFHDHARIEARVFEGALQPVDGQLVPDRSRAGLGLELIEREARPYALASAEQRRSA